MPAAAVGDGWVGGRSGWWRASIAASCSTLPLTVNISRAPRDGDVTIKVLFCGICHTDLHIIKNEWGNTMFPVVPGCVTEQTRDRRRRHGLTGVTKFAAGDTVGVGYLILVPRSCDSCRGGHENRSRVVLASNGVDRDGATTQGGFSDVVVVIDQGYVARVPGRLPPEAASPLLCAGHGVQQPHDAVRSTDSNCSTAPPAAVTGLVEEDTRAAISPSRIDSDVCQGQLA
ncbi:probable cinnamyl alcohol dehydrogenase 8D [Setaria viridis]|uniref:probable cinnamyl alcohol dehydrogenase 8D n=1 Tax=Setaria viridis TaxID=4556 RepID=UPI003B3B3737